MLKIQKANFRNTLFLYIASVQILPSECMMYNNFRKSKVNFLESF